MWDKLVVDSLRSKIQQNDAYARGFLEGFFGPGEKAHSAGSRNIGNALHWLEGWIEGHSRWVAGDYDVFTLCSNSEMEGSEF